MNRDRAHLRAAAICFVAAMLLIWQLLSINAFALSPPFVPSSATYHFDAGLNFIALAVEPTRPLSARGLLEAIDAQGGNAAWVTRWLNGGWDTHVKGLPFNDFAVEIGHGYFVFADQASDFVLTGRAIHVAPPLSLIVRWTAVGLPTWRGKTAEQVLKRLRVCSEIHRWNGADWDVYTLGGKHPFTIDAREGYFIGCEQPVGGLAK